MATTVARAIGIGWGLPASDGWDNDGIAPRDFLAGLVETFTPGHHFTYPPVHLLILGVLTSPVTLVALAKAPSLAPADVIGEILKVPYMTAIAYVARVTSLAMSIGITYAVAKMAAAVRGPRAACGAAAVSAVDLSLAYYGHTTNLDVPYLFWSSLALLSLTRAIAWREPERLKWVFVFAVLGVGSKDQAYGLFVLGAPLALAAWFAADAWARANAWAIGRAFVKYALVGASLFLVTDAVVFNPTGFRRRLAFLSGPASQDFAQYAKSLAGCGRVLVDALGLYASLWPAPIVVLVGGGIALHALRRRGDGARWAAGLVPLLAALSFTLTFNLVARRVEHRFILPQSVMLAVYGGLAFDAVLEAARSGVAGILARAFLALSFARGAFMVLAVGATLCLDPRYDAERFMRERFAAGDTVEVYGLNVYLPRIPDGVRVTRVGVEAASKRNPMPGFAEVTARFEDVESRRPRWIVVCNGWAWRYLLPPPPDDGSGAITPGAQHATRTDRPAGDHFRDLLAEKLAYRIAHESRFESRIWPWVDIHVSTGQPVWILERKAVAR